jgi:chromosome segregation ATPase
VDQKQSDEWYTNKELFEQLQHFRDDFGALSKDLTKEMYDIREEMTETKLLIKEYNGLRKEIETVKVNCNVCKKDSLTAEAKIKSLELDNENSKKKITELKDRVDKAETGLKTIKWVIGTITAGTIFVLTVLDKLNII